MAEQISCFVMMCVWMYMCAYDSHLKACVPVIFLLLSMFLP